MLGLAERLTAETGDQIPTDLGRIAIARGVRNVEFQPLLVDGGLSVTNDGFYIYIRCEPQQAARFTELFAKDGTGSSLPAPIAKRVRYTIAHEIAHTLLFDISTKPPTSKIPPQKGMGLRALEHSCNDVAGVILLPKAAIRKEFMDVSRVLIPNDLLSFAEKALVSRSSLVVRLDHMKGFEWPVGLVASANEKDGGWVLTAVTRHYALAGILPKAIVGAPVETLVGELALDLFSGSKSRVVLRLPNLDFECAIETNASGVPKQSCIITLRRI